MTDKEIKELKTLQTNVAEVLQSKTGGVTSLYLNNTMNYLGEIIFYLVGIACFVFPFIMKSVAPFHILKEITESDKILNIIPSRGEINTFDIAIKGIIFLCGILFIYVGMNLRTIRKRNSLLYKAFKSLELTNKFLTGKLAAIPSTETQELKGTLTELTPKDIGDVRL